MDDGDGHGHEDGDGDLVVSGCDCVERSCNSKNKMHTILKLKLTLDLLVGSSNWLMKDTFPSKMVSPEALFQVYTTT